jgi:hypothetical protein
MVNVFLTNKEFDGLLLNHKTLCVGKIKLNIGDPRVDIIKNEKNEIILNDQKCGYFKLKRCAYTCYGRYNDKENIQINYWENEKLSQIEIRELLIENILS